MSSIKTTQIDGDVSVGRNVAIGGKAEVAGSATIGHNLKVNGWLEAPNIKGANKGVFLTYEDLCDAYPEPHDGWMAGVGASTPFTAYIGNGGDWVATEGTIEVTVDMSQYTEDVAQLQEDIDEVAERVQTAETNITAIAQQSQAEAGYYECSTAAAEAAKTIAATGYALRAGGNIRIKMTNANTADAVTLNINNTGAKALYYNGAQASSTNSWEAGEVVEVYYDGERYQCGGRIVDDEPTADSNNLVKSGGVAMYLLTDVIGSNGKFYSFVVYDTNNNVGLGLTADGKLRFIEEDSQFSAKLQNNPNFKKIEAYIKGEDDGGFVDETGHIACYCDENGLNLKRVKAYTNDDDYSFYVCDKDGNIGLALTKNGYTILELDKNVLQRIKNKIDAVSREDVVKMFTPKVFCPKTIYALDGTTVQLFKNSLASFINPNNYELVFYDRSSSVKGHNYFYNYQYEASAEDPSFSFRIGLYDKVGDILSLNSNKTTIIPVQKGTSPATIKNILCIGDSFTDADIWVSELRRLLTGVVSEGYSDSSDSSITADSLTNINFIGTRDTSANQTPNEGIGGKHYEFFATDANSPFVNPSTSEVDFDYYMQTGNVKGTIQNPSGNDKIDYAIIILGTNGHYEEEYVRAIWDGLLAHNPSIKVMIGGRCMPVPFGNINGISPVYNYTTRCDKTIECNEFFEGMCEMPDYKDNFIYVDYNVRLDNLNNMPIDIVQANIRNSENYAKIKRGANDVHPNKEGYFQIADAFRGAFHYWCLDSNNNINN